MVQVKSSVQSRQNMAKQSPHKRLVLSVNWVELRSVSVVIIDVWRVFFVNESCSFSFNSIVNDIA